MSVYRKFFLSSATLLSAFFSFGRSREVDWGEIADSSACCKVAELLCILHLAASAPRHQELVD